MILEVLTSGPIETNAYLIACSKTKQAAVIDVPFESANGLVKRAEDLGVSIQMILLTHSHWDHIGEVSLLAEKLKVPVHVHAEDAKNVERPGSDGLRLFSPVKGVHPTSYLQDGQQIALGELIIEVIHTPGHTPGGVCFYLAKEKTLISGDTLFKGGMGRIDLPTARPHLMWDSLKRLSALPPDTRVYPGHGNPTTIGAEQ